MAAPPSQGRLCWLDTGADHASAELPLFHSKERFVTQQLGPPPAPWASAGLTIQYASMRKTRLRCMAVDHACNVLESAALLAVKAVVCVNLESGAVAAGAVCWRLVFAPLW